MDNLKENKIILLDAGVSTIDSKPNYGLMQFKHNLGFSESLTSITIPGKVPNPKNELSITE